jgi:hypothetical protein
MKICPVRADLFHADGLTDLTKLIFSFHNFANAPKIVYAKSVIAIICAIPKAT